MTTTPKDMEISATMTPVRPAVLINAANKLAIAAIIKNDPRPNRNARFTADLCRDGFFSRQESSKDNARQSSHL
jgi:hypothetical protein